MQALLWLRGPHYDVESEIRSLEEARVVEKEDENIDAQMSNKFVVKSFKLMVRLSPGCPGLTPAQGNLYF